MASSTELDQVIHNAVEKYNSTYKQHITNLKPLQHKAVQSLLAGRDVLCCLPTGYGKSLVYELLPFLFENCFVVIIEPLSIIIKQQEEKLGKSAVCLNKGNYQKDGINFLFSHPEDIIDNKEFVDVVCSETFQKKKLFLVVDESHCIIDWGEDFRPKFKHLGQLRAVMDCQVVALSATVTKPGQQVIRENLLMTNCDTISTSPAKENISFIILKRPSAHARGNTANTPYDYIFHPVLEELKMKLDTFPITIIYCKSMQWIGYGYELARRYLEDNFYKHVNSPDSARVVMFHSSMEKESRKGKLKEMILNTLQKPDSECCIRLVISSIALGMGADLRHVSRVIHAGPPTTMEAYVQEVGRAGREDVHAQAILFYNSSDLGVKHIRAEMKNYCQSKKCLREVINEFFWFPTEIKPSSCCNICQSELGIE